MDIYISIDDTDNLESTGSGELADFLRHELQDNGLVSWSSSIARHQLLEHTSIAYTSHNSSMCFQAAIAEHSLAAVIEYSQSFLKRRSAVGSDPGLCVAVENDGLDRARIIEFGLAVKQSVVTKPLAYALARETGVHLSEHGGTGDGIIGALAAIGLYLSGSDGRIRGWLQLGENRQSAMVKDLCSHAEVDGVVDAHGSMLAADARVEFNGEKIKTVRSNHLRVIPVARDEAGPVWKILTKAEVKCF